VEIWKATVGENHPAFAQSLVGLASICHAVGRYPEAETLAQQALRIEQGHGLVRADTLTSLASVLESLGRYEQAEGILRRAIETTRAALGEEHPEFATSLNNLGLLCRTTGHFGEAGRLLQQALEIRRKTLGDCHPLVATSLNSLADLHLATGDYVEAEREFHKALELRRSLLGNRHVDVATSLSNLAALYLDLGDDVGGEALMVEALQIRRMTLGEAHPHVALLLNNLACVYLARGDRARAQEHFERALSIRMDVLGESHPLCAESLGGRAAVHWMAGEYNDAEQRYRRVLAIFREVYGEQHPLAAKTAASLGALYYANGRYELAESHLQQSLASQRSGLADQHPDIVSTLRHLGAVCAATTRTTEALRLLREAAALEDRTIGQGLAIGSERQRLGFLQSAELHVHMFLSLVWRLMPDSAEAVGAALDLIFRRKGVGMEALASQRSAILCGRYPHLKGQLYDLDSLRMQIAQQTLDGPGLEPVDIHRQRLAEWNARREWLEAELARQIPELNLEMRLREANCHTVAAALPPGSVLIDFIRFHQFDFHAVPARGEAQWKPPRYLAFVLTAGKPSDVRMIDLGEAEKLEGLVADYRAAVTGQGAQRGVSVVPAKMVDQRTLAASRTLCAAVFDRLTPPVGSSRRLLIAPDGDLCRLPFETLPLENGRYVIDEYQVSYLGCGRDALRFGTQTSGHASEPLVVADPDFDLAAPAPAADQPQAAAHHRRSRDLDPQTLRFERLPGTRVEGERIGTLLGVRPWLGGMALDGRLKSRCRSPRILHLATHGFFLENQRNEPNKQPGPWGAIASGATTTGRLSGPFLENPLLRSGLALAGAETWRQGGRPPAEAEDGLLTAEDVSRLDLSATELAVLSACDTGLGEIRTGEGVFGLRRAFILAGARTLVMSLWKVPDDQTQELMIDFHRRLLAGESRAESLRQAQLSLKARHPNAYYWGAFICQGVP
jgi:CHAT domain-containing protein/tetratricopeptide (TPR) repeat protein